MEPANGMVAGEELALTFKRSGTAVFCALTREGSFIGILNEETKKW